MSDALLAADLFCGAGGTSTGLMMAAERLGRAVDLLAINHWNVAIETHQANHPGVRHLCTGLESVTPADVVPGGRLNLLWASPSCTHHSVARGGRPRCNQSRAQPMMLFDWTDQLYVERLMVENVPAFTGWGPLGANGKPLPSRRGVLFADFVQSLKARGYRVDWRVLNCADYGDPTTRERFFLQAVRGRGRIVWPEPTHAAAGKEAGKKRWIPARDIIDWSIPGRSIFRRKKPLADNTLCRIEAGIRKFGGVWAEPFLVVLRGTREPGRTARSLDLPLPTATAGGGHVGLVEPFLTVMNNFPSQQAGYPLGRPLPTQTSANHAGLVQPFIVTVAHGTPDGNYARRARSADEAAPTLTASNSHAVVHPFIVPQCTPGRTRSVDEALATLTTTGAHALVQPFLVSFYGQGEALSIDQPIATVTTKDRFGVAWTFGLDILFRMLQPHELALAHSFPPGYLFRGTKTDIVKQIGNSVPVRTTAALCGAVLEDAA